MHICTLFIDQLELKVRFDFEYSFYRLYMVCSIWHIGRVQDSMYPISLKF